MSRKMTVLGIETSCDETGIALVEATGGLNPSTRSGQATPRFKILKNLVASEIKTHRPFGGVVPMLAKREHIKNLPILFRKIFGVSKKSLRPKSCVLSSIDLIAVTVGPGLEPALWTGINFATELATSYQLPATSIIGTNHLEGHLYSFLLPSKSSTAYASALLSQNIFPAIALIVSGGHTVLLYVESFSKWTRLGETRDDAAGEAFDKVARLLGLPYPGGPEIEKLARRGNPFTVTFPRPMIHDKSYDFSFSGLKTAVLYHLRDRAQINADSTRTNTEISMRRSVFSQRKSADAANIAASFEQAVVDVLAAKTKRAAEEYAAESIILSGGVAANKHLRRALKRAASLVGAKFFAPDFKYNLDNAAMIAVAGYFAYLKESKSAKGGPASGGKKLPLKANGGLDI